VTDHNSLTHKFISTKTESPDSTIVSKNEWNEEHIFNGGISGQALTYDGSQTDHAKWTTLPLKDLIKVVYVQSAPSLIVVNNSVETTVFTHYIDGGVLTDNKFIQLKVTGQYFNNSGGDSDFYIKVKYDTIPIANFTFAARADSAYIKGWLVDLHVRGQLNEPLRVYSIGNAKMGTTGYNSVTASIVGDELLLFVVIVTSDTNISHPLTITLQHSIPDANISAQIDTVLIYGINTA
jgi:hypothetical protein